MKPPTASRIRSATLAMAAMLAFAQAAYASGDSRELSEASLVPIAISVALPVILVSDAGAIVILGVQASAEGTVWLVENAADGVKGSITFAGNAIAVSGIAVGTVIVVTVVATGRLLSAAGHVIAFIPNELGRTLSYNQRVSR